LHGTDKKPGECKRFFCGDLWSGESSLKTRYHATNIVLNVLGIKPVGNAEEIRDVLKELLRKNTMVRI